MSLQTYVILNDIQYPFEDKRAMRLVLGFIDDLKPQGVILNGDIVDCYSISDFDRSPLSRASLDREIRCSQSLMGRLHRVPIKLWIGGNHEDRLRRHVWKNPKLLRDLDQASRERVVAALDFPEVFGLGEHGFSWLPYGGTTYLGKLLVTHGSMVSRHSGQTARAHMDKYGTSVLIGHTHRGGVHYKRDIRGVHAGYENFCLCRLDPEYVQNPNWQQGFSVVHVASNGFFNVQQIPILPGNRFFSGGTEVKG
ncbi:MAG TPA: metallophosphoesterase [Candidatus Paceibacterota bacterium]